MLPRQSVAAREQAINTALIELFPERPRSATNTRKARGREARLSEIHVE